MQKQNKNIYKYHIYKYMYVWIRAETQGLKLIMIDKNDV